MHKKLLVYCIYRRFGVISYIVIKLEAYTVIHSRLITA